MEVTSSHAPEDDLPSMFSLPSSPRYAFHTSAKVLRRPKYGLELDYPFLQISPLHRNGPSSTAQSKGTAFRAPAYMRSNLVSLSPKSYLTHLATYTNDYGFQADRRDNLTEHCELLPKPLCTETSLPLCLSFFPAWRFRSPHCQVCGDAFKVVPATAGLAATLVNQALTGANHSTEAPDDISTAAFLHPTFPPAVIVTFIYPTPIRGDTPKQRPLSLHIILFTLCLKAIDRVSRNRKRKRYKITHLPIRPFSIHIAWILNSGAKPDAPGS